MQIWVRAGFALTALYLGAWPTSAVSQVYEPATETTTKDALSNSKALQKGLSGLTECAQMAARLEQDKALLRELDKTKGFLDVLGKTLTAASVASNTAKAYKTGEIDGLATDTQGLVVSQAGCMAFGIFCPVFRAGMGVGTIINYAPKVFDSTNRTLNDMWTDLLVAKLYPEPSKEALLDGIAQFKARIRQAEAEAAAAEARNAQCVAVEKRKTAIDEMLKKATPPPNQSTAAGSGYAEGLFGQSVTEASDPDSAQRLAQEQSKKLGQVDQLTNEARAQGQAAAAAVWQQGLTALPALKPSSPPTTYSMPNGVGPSGPVDNRRCIASIEMCAEMRGMTVEEYLRSDPPNQ